MAPGSDRMLGDVSFFPDSLGDEQRHKETLLHTYRDIQGPTYTRSHSLTYIAYRVQRYAPMKTVVRQNGK